MRELYLHVGLHKTGTTYLQKLLLENRAELLAAGLGLAPYQDPVLGTHHPMLQALEREGASAVLARVAETPGARVLASAEELSRYFEDPGRARAVRDAALAHFAAVRLVVFLRRQDFLKESYYAELVKLSLQGGIEAETGYDYDHDARLRRLEAIFGAGNVLVRLYRDPGPNDLAGELFAALGVEVDPAALRPVERLNPSLPRRKVMFLSHVPKPRRLGGPRDAFLAHFLRRLVADTAAIHDDGSRFLLPPAERRALVARHLEGNRAVAARYRLEDAAGFVSLPDADPGWRPPAPIAPAEMHRVARGALSRAWAGRGPAAGLRVSLRLAVLLARTAWQVGRAAGAGPVPAPPAPGRPAQPAYPGAGA